MGGDVIDGHGSIDHIGQDATYDHLDPLIERIAESAFKAWVGHHVLDIVLDDRASELPGIKTQWLQAVRETFEPFRGMPDPAGFDWEVAEVGYSAKIIQVTTGGSGPGPISDDDGSAGLALPGTLAALATRAGQMQGKTAKSFSVHYVAPLPTLIQNLCATTNAQAIGLASEQVLWTRARKDVVSIAHQADSAMMQAGPDDGDSGWKVALTVIGVVAGAAATIASAGGAAFATAALVSGLTSLGASTAAGLISDEGGTATEVALGADTPEDVLDNLRTALSRLRDDIEREERKVADFLEDLLGSVDDDGHFDIASPALLRDTCAPHVLADDQVFLDRSDIRLITDHLLPDVAGTLDRSTHVRSAPAVGHWTRSGGLGLGPAGPFEAYATLNAYVAYRAGNTSGELRASADHLRIAAAGIGAADTDANRRLAAHTRALRKAHVA